MKRSDVIELVEVMLKNYDNMNFATRPTFEQFATAIINTLQDLGMAPPKYEPFPGSDQAFETREWEKEDA